MEKDNSFTGWAIVEMMGHRTEIGYVTTEHYGTAAMFRVDTPPLTSTVRVLEHPEYALVQGDRMWCPPGSKVERRARRSQIMPDLTGGGLCHQPLHKAAAIAALELRTSRPLIAIALPTRPPFDSYLPEPETQHPDLGLADSDDALDMGADEDDDDDEEDDIVV